MIYVWLSRLLYQAPAGPQQSAALSTRCLRGLVSTERSLTPVDVGVRVWGRGEEPARTNETSLSVCGLHHPTKRKMCVWEKEPETVWAGVCVVYGCNVCMLCGRMWDFSVCLCRGWGYFNTCYILWQQSDSRFRSVQKMRLTQRCSPQPQCNLHFLKPAPVLYATPV